MADRETNTATPLPCPFCAREVQPTERPATKGEGGGYLCFIACFCDGYSACAHKMERGNTAAAARAGAIAVWNRRAAPAAQGATAGAWLIEHTDGTLEKTRDRNRADLARHLGHLVTPLYAAPIGQEEDAARWQPIETAPKEGPCLLWVDTDYGGEAMVLERHKKGEWLYDGSPLHCAPFWMEPKYWMPLPPPPSAQQAGQAETGEPT